MIEVIKKTLFAGLGAAVITKETVDGALREWIEKGKISPEEARHFSERLVSAGSSRWEGTRDALSVRIEELMSAANLATRVRLEALETRVALLETKCGAHENSCRNDSAIGGA